MTRSLNALVFGGCLVRRPLRAVPNIEQKLNQSRFFGMGTVHSFGEMFQALDFLTGNKDVPREQRLLTGIGLKLNPFEDPALLCKTDVALIELGSPVDILFRGTVVNRARIDKLMKDVASQSRDVFKLYQKWMRVGLVGMNEDVRQSLGEKIEALLPDDNFFDLRRAVLHEARAEKSDISTGFKKMRARLDCPLGTAIFVFRYMPDGRPIIWPAGTREEVIAAAGALGIPVFEPVAMVQAYGVERALEADGKHYAPAFLPVIGEALVKFTQDLHTARAATPAVC